MRPLVLAIGLVVAFCPMLGSAQELTPAAGTHVFDANGKYMGALVFGQSLRFRLSDGRSVLLPLSGRLDQSAFEPVIEWSPGQLFFLSEECTGDPFVEAFPWRGITSSAVVSGTALFVATTNGALTAIQPHSKFLGSNCFTVAGGFVAVYPAGFHAGLDTLFQMPFSFGGPPAPAGPSFADVPSSHPLYEFVELMKAAGITAGCGAGNYCPDAPVTRGQMAVFIVRTLGLRWAP